MQNKQHQKKYTAELYIPHYLREIVFYHEYEKHFSIKVSEQSIMMRLKQLYK